MAMSGRRAALLESARRRFAAAGVEGTSLDVIRSEVGASTGSLYHHFPSKAHLVAAVYVDALVGYQEEFVATLRDNATAEGGVRAVVRLHVGWCVDHQDRARMLFRERAPQADEPGSEALRSANRAFFDQVLAWWGPHVHYGVLRELPVAELYVLWLAPAQELCRLWLAGYVEQPTSDSTELLAEAAWLALRQPDADTSTIRRGE